MTDTEIIEAAKIYVNRLCEHRCDQRRLGLEPQCNICLVNCVKEAFRIADTRQAELEELKVATGLMGNRKYYNKFVKEVFQKENGSDLIYPDFDEIYKRYFEQKEEIDRLRYNLKAVCKEVSDE